MMLGTADGGTRLFKMEAVSSLQCRSSLSEPKPCQSLWRLSPPPLGSPSCCSLTAHRSSVAMPSKRALYSPSPPSTPDMSTAPGHELVAGAQLNWSHWNPAHHLWDHSPVSLFPRGQCSLFPDRQAQKDSGGHWSLAPSTSVAALSRRAQADCAQTLTWLPGRTRRLWCKGNPPSPWGLRRQEGSSL